MRADPAWADAQRRHTFSAAQSADGEGRSPSSPNLFRRRFCKPNRRKSAWALGLVARSGHSGQFTDINCGLSAVVMERSGHVKVTPIYSGRKEFTEMLRSLD